MIIQQPKINFANTKRAFQQFAANYNARHDESRVQLKPAHFAQFYVYLRLMQRNMSQECKRAINSGHPEALAINTDDLPHLFTNNTEMRKQLDGGHPSTFIRRADRLIKAGAILKINHGPVRNYEIIINPHLLFIYDESGRPDTLRPNLEQAEKWLEPGGPETSKIAKCKQNIVSLKEHSNKIIIHQAESAATDNSSKAAVSVAADSLLNKKDTLKDTPENVAKSDFGSTVLATINVKIEQKLAEKGVAPAKNETPQQKTACRNREFRQLKLQYATMLVQLMIDYLTKGVTIFNGERNRTISYVEQHYFGECYTLISLQRTFEQYTKRLEDARRFKELHPGYTPYPFKYFQLDYNNGFNSAKWKKNRVKWEKLKQNSLEQAKLMAAIRRVNTNPIYEVYQREIEFVKNNIPDKLKQFFAAMYKNHSQLIKQKQAS